MTPLMLQKIRENPLLSDYLKVDSSWYKRLNRNEDCLKDMEKAAKKCFKLTGEDKLERAVDQMMMISAFMDVFQ